MDDLSTLSLGELLDLGIRRDNEAKIAKARSDEAKSELRRRYPDAKILEVPDRRVKATVTHVRKFDEDLAKQVLNEGELAQITVPKLDGAKAKKLFGEAQYELMSRPDTPRISFKMLEE